MPLSVSWVRERRAVVAEGVIDHSALAYFLRPDDRLGRWHRAALDHAPAPVRWATPAGQCRAHPGRERLAGARALLASWVSPRPAPAGGASWCPIPNDRPAEHPTLASQENKCLLYEALTVHPLSPDAFAARRV